MITHLKGFVHCIGIDHVVLDVQGVGYHVVCSSQTLANLKVGESVLLITELVIREDAHLLYGFQSFEERDMYRLLVSVPGVGARVAMALLSRGSPGQLIHALQEEDKDFLCQAEGVGPKLGARLITELKNHVKKLAFIRPDVRTAPKQDGRETRVPLAYLVDARSALTSLGYKPHDIEQAIQVALEKDADINSLEHLIRLSLQQLGRQR